ncbi:hypothetical protein NX059_002897 [Plenodomus lindquistii]|nr:hypothetical protein NX059_002897 [Plenodomus lindquistii]
MASNNTHPNGYTNGHNNPHPSSPTVPSQPTYYSSSTELADLGRERFDHDTAEITSRDHALLSGVPIAIRQGRAPRGLESQVFAWTTFQHTTEERDDREELKGDLHEGQLHRQNRAAQQGMGMGFGDGEVGGGKGFGGGRYDGGRGGFEGRGRGRGRGRGMGGFEGGRGGEMRGRGGRGGRGGRMEQDDGHADTLCAGRKPDSDAPPLAKGFAEELDKSMFWDGPIV